MSANAIQPAAIDLAAMAMLSISIDQFNNIPISIAKHFVNAKIGTPSLKKTVIGVHQEIIITDCTSTHTILRARALNHKNCKYMSSNGCK